MSTTEERVDRLETAMAELADAQLRTQIALKTFSENTEASLNRLTAEVNRLSVEMREFKDEMRESRNEAKREMREFKDEMRESRNESKREMREFKDEMRESRNESKREMQEFRDEERESRKSMNQRWGELANQLGTVVENIVAPNIPRMAKELFGFSEIEDFMVRRQVRSKRDRSKRREFDVIVVGEDAVIINETKSKTRIAYVDDFIEVLGQVFDYFPEYADKKIIPIFASLHLDESVVNYLTQNRIYAMTMGGQTMEIVNFQQVEG